MEDQDFMSDEFIKDFVDEALTHIEKVESGLLRLETIAQDPEIINEIFRAVHSIKGTAGFFGFKKIVELAHAMENLFGEVRSGKLVIDHGMADILLAANDTLKSMIDDVGASEEVDIADHLGKIAGILGNKNQGNKEAQREKIEPQRVEIIVTDEEKKEVIIAQTGKEIIQDAVKHGHKLYKVRVRMNEDLGVKEINPVTFFKKISSIGNIIDSYTDTTRVGSLDAVLNTDINFVFLFTTVLEKSLVSLALEIPETSIFELDINTKKEEFKHILMEKDVEEVPDAEKPAEFAKNPVQAVQTVQNEAKKAQAHSGEDSIRVQISLLNDLLNLASEMVLGRNQLLRAMEGNRKSIPGIDPILQNIDHITTELQEKIMQTRMQPVANVFNKFPRIIRELSKKLGKDIELYMNGAEVELDKSIIEALADPLTHLIRNAADHGIESPEARAKTGKPKKGSIVLKAYHEGGHVNIDIIDDGAGIDAEAIKQKALQKGLITQTEAALMSERDIHNLLFKPGFSTAEKITDVSGRGVGMDVVRTNIEKLGGTIDIITVPGKGTTFRLTLPLTLAIIPSLIVEVAGQKFALPQVNLQEMVRIKTGDKARKIEYVHNSQVLRLRDKLLPVVRLADVLGLQQDTGRVNNHNPVGENENNEVVRVLVLRIGTKRFGLAVDIIHDGEEILVKPLPRYLKDCKCYSGVTIMGDGKTAMILDPDGIALKAKLKFTDENKETAQKDRITEEEGMREQQNILLFKCTGSETFGIDLAMVARVEKISRDQIEKIGDKEYIKFRGSSLRVIRPENYLPVTKGQSTASELFVIIPKLVKHPLGIIMENIYDTLQTRIKFNEDDLKTKGIVGSCILNEKIVLIMNIYELFEMAAPEYYAVDKELQRTGEKKVILVAEDTPFFANMEKSYLEWAGYDVLMAGNGKEALEILQQQKVDVVVSDINMPVMDGLELVKAIRADKKLANLPVIAVTSMTGEQQEKTIVGAGFDFYEAKLDKGRLLEKLELLLQKRRHAG